MEPGGQVPEWLAPRSPSGFSGRADTEWLVIRFPEGADIEKAHARVRAELTEIDNRWGLVFRFRR